MWCDPPVFNFNTLMANDVHRPRQLVLTWHLRLCHKPPESRP